MKAWPHMSLDECVGHLRQGYCLWVGAGVAAQLAQAGAARIPDWPGLTTLLEADAAIAPPPGVELPYPLRLEVVLKHLGRERFQKALRRHALEPLSRAVVAAAESRQARRDGAIIPAELRQLVKLGHAANPIVNFNVEHLTSWALGASRGFGPAGPGWELKAFAPPVPGNVAGIRCGGGGAEAGDRSFRRHIYHPHGAIEVSGICVITESEYSAMSGTLALQLAVHAAFHGPLLIVGMSLDDEYLRAQLAEFRPYIHEILWIREGTVSRQDEAWAYSTNVRLVVVEDWSHFWERVDGLAGPSESAIIGTWSNVLLQARRAIAHDASIERARNHGFELSTEWQRLHELRGREAVGPEDLPRLDPADVALKRYLWDVVAREKSG